MALRLIKFGGDWCSACKHMDRTRVLQQFAASTLDVEVLKHDVPGPDDDGAEPEDLIADEYDVNSLPVLVFEDSESGQELARFEGALNLSELRKLHARAVEIRSGAKKTKKDQAKREGGYNGVKERAEKAVHEAPEAE